MNNNEKSLVKNEWLSEDEYRSKPISNEVSKNIDYISNILGNSFDLVTRELVLKNNVQEFKIGIALMEGLTDTAFVNEIILSELNKRFSKLDFKLKKGEILENFETTLLLIANVDIKKEYGDLINHLLNGDTILFIDGYFEFFAISSKKYKERAIEEPKNKISVKGSKESFNENLATNVSLLRRRMKNPNLWIKLIVVGKKTNCNIAIVYIKGLADEAILDTIVSRLNREEIESIVDSSYLKHYLREEKHSIFPLIYDTERPDSVMGSLYEGRFAIIVDGSPDVLVAPVTFFNFLTSVEDYYNKTFVASSLRILRYIALVIAVLLPGFYMCVVKFNSELLPINMMYSISGQRANVPLPADLEIILTIFAFDLLTEAGTRMPRAVGTALSFVGAIVIGQAAVDANLISSMMLIVVAVNGIGTLLIPDYDMGQTLKFIRYFILLLSLAFGILGFTISSFILLVHLISLRSFGKPYMQPLAPLVGSGILDSIIIAPLGKLINRKKKGKKEANEKN